MAAKDKIKTVYVCSECGETSMRWLGRCPSCGAWNTMTEDVVVPTPPPSAKSPAAIAARAQASTLMAKNLRDISSTEEKSRILTGIKELDRVLGGYSRQRLMTAASRMISGRVPTMMRSFSFPSLRKEILL